ncbi:MAG: type I-G CRISPR-associated RAMP protein Csb1/Cas7g [Opitutaceae bacterium]
MTQSSQQSEDKPKPLPLTDDLIDWWAGASEPNDPKGIAPVALYLKQKLVPVEGDGGVIFPPTYADIGYNIDTLSDGTKVVTVDSVGSQANRMEPIFKQAPYSRLVPQIEIEIHTKDEDDGKYVEKRSIFDLAHRSADAVVHSSPKLAPQIAKAFTALKQRGDAGPLCRLAPTSLVFGVWDSRGGSAEKRPRLVRSIIRAWDVELLHAAAQFNSIWKALNEDQKAELKKASSQNQLSGKGFADAPATFRKLKGNAAREMPEFRDGSPNPERRVLGGVISKGPIQREITINLVALRGINGKDEGEGRQIRRYLLTLAVVAATADIELFLREGSLLRFADKEDAWMQVPRRGALEPVDLASSDAKKTLLDYADKAVKPFSAEWPKELVHKFDLPTAKKLLAKKDDPEEGST